MKRAQATLQEHESFEDNKSHRMAGFPHTFQMKQSPHVWEKKGVPPPPSWLGWCPFSSAPWPPQSMNKAGFVERMNEDSFLLGIFLKLESRGLLPSMTPVRSGQPIPGLPLISNDHLAVAESSADLRCGSWRIFSHNRTKGSLGKPGKTTQDVSLQQKNW